MISFLQGFGLGGSLIVAIGAQNAFVLSQGVRRNHPLTIALICAFCDSILILFGVTGVGTLVASNPLLANLTLWGGVLFLAWYGAVAFHAAWKGNFLEAEINAPSTLRAVITTTLAITLLNPHVYLDTLILLGGLSSQFQGGHRLAFGVGAMTASFLWFLSLSFGAGLLAPIFRKKTAWRVLDGTVCVTMWGIAASLVMNNVL